MIGRVLICIWTVFKAIEVLNLQVLSDVRLSNIGLPFPSVAKSDRDFIAGRIMSGLEHVYKMLNLRERPFTLRWFIVGEA